MRETPVRRNAVPLEPQHSSNSRGLRPLPPTPKREVVAQRILRCGKRNTQALCWHLLPDSFQMWFETTRFVYFVKLKHVSRTFFNLKLQRTAFHSKKCSQKVLPDLPKSSQNVSKVLPGASRRRPERPHTPPERPRSVPDTPKWQKCRK